MIGTVLKQQEPYTNYVNQFGPFWAGFFRSIGLYSVYSAWWFLLILLFLVISTSLCIARNTPKIWADIKTHKENMRWQSLQAFGQRAKTQLDEVPLEAAQRISGLLRGAGWSVKLQMRKLATGEGWMVAAKAGGASKLGYIAAHSAIVLVCLGGLLDGDLMIRAQMLLNAKTTFNGGGMLADVKSQHRLGPENPTFRANLLVTEGTRSSTAVINQSDGILLQDLPFSIELRKFVVAYYSTGMPKLFASDIVIHDLGTKETMTARVEVNHPVYYKGTAIYQSSFDDGGSAVKLKALPMGSQVKPFEVQGIIGGQTELTNGKEKLNLEYTQLRVINVENFANQNSGSVDVRKVDLRRSIDDRLGAANKTVKNKALRNVGPSISYKLRDVAGQAREFNNYMLPIDMGDGAPMFMFGVRDSPSEPFRYLRVPADDQESYKDFFEMRRALSDARVRDLAVQRYVRRVIDVKRPDLIPSLTASAKRALGLFAGVEANRAGAFKGGLQAVGEFIETNVPEAERIKAGDVLVRILNGSLFELLQIIREEARKPPMPNDEKTQAFMTQAVLSLSDSFAYPVPMVMMLEDFTQVQASVFQVTRAPGQKIVYLGCALLILGVFAMLYIRERRVWVWLSTINGNTQALMAMSSNRKTMDGDNEFFYLQNRLIGNREKIK